MMTKRRMRRVIGERLKALRMTQNLTSDQFAKSIGVKGGRYRRWQRGEVQPPLEVIYEIRRVTGYSLDRLIFGAPYTQTDGGDWSIEGNLRQ